MALSGGNAAINNLVGKFRLALELKQQIAHLVSNGDLGSIVLFGSFLLWAVYDRVSLKYRADAGAPPIPAGGRRNDVIAIVLGTVLYLLLGFVFHPLVIGRAVFGRAAF